MTFHAGPFDIVDHLVHMLTATIKLGRVNVHNEGLAGCGRDRHPRGIGHPVMSVNDVKFLSEGQFCRDCRIALYLSIHVPTIVFPAAELLCVFSRRGEEFTVIGADPLQPSEVFLRCRVGLQRGRYPAELDIFESGRVGLCFVPGLGGEQLDMGRVVTVDLLGQDKRDLYSQRVHCSSQSIAGCPQSTTDEGRELPTEHEHSN